MRVFLAGASGVIGRRLVPMLIDGGHEVAGTTRSEEKAVEIAAQGATAVIVDVYDADALLDAVVSFETEVVLHELTDLPDDPSRLADFTEANARIRIEGTANLISAARAAGASRLLAQSLAWRLPPGSGAEGVAALEAMVVEFGGTVLRYGQFYGPGTFHPDTVPAEPRVLVDTAARHTVSAIDLPPGVLTITDEGMTRA